MHLKPQEMDLLRFLRKHRRWMKVRELLEMFPSNTPTRRLTSLNRAGLIEKRRYPFDPRYVEYKAKGATA
jgi:DNA-binding HxlR family transcriptional regulator